MWYLADRSFSNISHANMNPGGNLAHPFLILLWWCTPANAGLMNQVA